MTIFLLPILALCAIYVGTVEAAFSALMRLSLRLTVERTGRSAGLGVYLDDPVLLFVPARLLMGAIITIAAILFAAWTGMDDMKDPWVLGLAMFGFVLAFEHLIPLLIVRYDPERVLIALLPSFTMLTIFLRPLTRSLVGIIATLRRERQTQPSPDAGSPAEDETAGEAAHAYLEAGEQEGLIEREERRLIESIVDFGDTLVREVMTPRPDIIGVRADASLVEVRQLFADQQYSRVPVYRDSLDRILGFVFVKDLIRLPLDLSATEPVVERLLRPAHYVPETKKVSELLKEFQRQQVQSAVVVDEYGGTAGLVTIEDLLEEIVGEIRDEYDVESEPVQDEGNGVFVFSGKVGIDELNERLGVDIPREGFGTIGGYLLAQLGRVPAMGEQLDLDGLHVEVLEAERRRVMRVRVRRKVAEPPAVPAGQPV
jgi:CBS domain containing-hemolysin-like protein